MGNVKLTYAAGDFTVDPTGNYNGASPVDVGTWTNPVDLDNSLLSVGGSANYEGALLTFTTAQTFSGAYVKVSIAYGAGVDTPVMELWTKTGAVWTKRKSITVSEPNLGVPTGILKVYDFFLDAAVADVTHLWVTLNPVGASPPAVAIFRCLHPYKSATVASYADPFAVASGTVDPSGRSRPRSADPSTFTAGMYVTLAYSLDLAPIRDDDEVASALGAWSIWDLPATVATQIDNEEGNDLILFSTTNRVYVLDWGRRKDEWVWEEFNPIYRRLVLGPLPSSPDASEDPSLPATRQPLERHGRLKRFRLFRCTTRDTPTETTPRVRIACEEVDNVASRRTTLRTNARRIETKIAVRGQGFLVTLEHADDDDFRPTFFEAEWDDLGPRVQDSAVTT
jgi:hypothetical protein